MESGAQPVSHAVGRPDPGARKPCDAGFLPNNKIPPLCSPPTVDPPPTGGHHRWWPGRRHHLLVGPRQDICGCGRRLAAGHAAEAPGLGAAHTPLSLPPCTPALPTRLAQTPALSLVPPPPHLHPGARPDVQPLQPQPARLRRRGRRAVHLGPGGPGAAIAVPLPQGEPSPLPLAGLIPIQLLAAWRHVAVTPCA